MSAAAAAGASAPGRAAAEAAHVAEAAALAEVGEELPSWGELEEEEDGPVRLAEAEEAGDEGVAEGPEEVALGGGAVGLRAGQGGGAPRGDRS